MNTCTRSPSYLISANIPFGHFLMAEANDLHASANIGFTGVITLVLILSDLDKPGISSLFFKQRSTTSWRLWEAWKAAYAFGSRASSLLRIDNIMYLYETSADSLGAISCMVKERERWSLTRTSYIYLIEENTGITKLYDGKTRKCGKQNWRQHTSGCDNDDDILTHALLQRWFSNHV